MSTTSLKKICSLKNRTRVIYGGQGSGKTFSIVIYLIDYCLRNPHAYVIVCSKELTKLRMGAIKDFLTIMRMYNRFNRDQWTNGTLYTFKNGSQMKFVGLDSSDIGKGVRSDAVFIDEVNRIDHETYVQITSRSKLVFCAFNPDAHFYLSEQYFNRNDVDVLKLTYRDNECLDINEVNSIKQYLEMYNQTGHKYWLNKHNVYSEGNFGVPTGVVYENGIIIDSVPSAAVLDCYGLDFGFSNDPSALVEVYKLNGSYYVKEVVYKTKLFAEQIAEHITRKDLLVYCDSAEPRTIADLKRNGIKAVEADKKGKEYQVSKMQELKEIFFCGTNLAKEVSEYRFKDNGDLTGVHHALDATRYAVYTRYLKTKVSNSYV